MADEGMHPTPYPWSHNGWFNSFDHARSVAITPRGRTHQD